MSARLKRDRALGNCVPALMLIHTLCCHLRGIGEGHGIEEAIEVCKNTLDEYVECCPAFYRKSMFARASKIANRILNQYCLPQKFTTSKLLMILHYWIFDLAHEDLIDIYSEDYKGVLEDIDTVFREGMQAGGETLDGTSFTAEDIERRYNSAVKQAKKIHDFALEEGLYRRVEIVYV